MNIPLVNFPPWLQTLFTGAALVSFAVPTVVRLMGAETSAVGSRLIRFCNDWREALRRGP